MSLTTKVLIGLAAGVATGVFFGESTAYLDVIGRAFILLLQISVLPFMVVALVSGLGRLSVHEAVAIAKSGGVVLLVLWANVMTAVLVFPLAFPDWESASFFSRSLVEAPQAVDFLELYIPSNPFHSLAGGVVPAIVVFSLALGIALMGVENKKAVLDVLDALRVALDRITGFVVRLAPLGVFALMASAAGTLDVGQLGRIQVYVLGYVALALSLSLAVLPALVSTFTPLRYREVLGPVRDALVTAFATGNLLIVLPILAQHGKQILQDADLDPEASNPAIDVLVPASFTIPNMGKLLSLAFVPFAGWFTGFALSTTQYPVFAAVGFASFFGEPVVSLPFLLDLMQVPADTFQLFVAIDVITSRFGTLLAAVHTLVLALVAAFLMTGKWTFRRSRFLLFAIGTIFALAVPILGTRLIFTYAVEPQYGGYREFVELRMISPRAESRVLEEPPASLPANGRDRLDRILERGRLRVGYLANALPFAFRNAHGDLVGFDIEMMHLLARELKVALDFVQVGRERGADALKEGVCDIIVSGVPITPQRSRRAFMSRPVMDLTLAFVVPDDEREHFAEWSDISRRQDLVLGIGPDAYYRARVESLLPDAEIVALDSPRVFFRGDPERVHALVMAAENGSAWTLVYPSFSVAVPLPERIAVPVGYAMPRGATSLHAYVDAFVNLKVKDGTTQRLFAHWFEGRTSERKRPRWSVARDVLGWFE